MSRTAEYPRDAPHSSVLEVSVFGPGVGECVVAQLGGGQWLVVDSCTTAAGAPVALEYLDAIGVPTSAVARVVATHWHDDHIDGLAQVVAAASSATFVCSSALRQKEFYSLVVASKYVRKSLRLSPGLGEMTDILELLKARGQHPTWASHDQLLLRGPDDDSGATMLTSLSPSAATQSRATLAFARLAPKLKAALKAVPDVQPNETSVVLHVQSGRAVVLLGADLEAGSPRGTGWQAILESTERPPARASVYKVAHHGSAGADAEGLWTTLLTPRPTATLTPFSRSRLPTPDDVRRLADRAGRLFQTAPVTVPRFRRDGAVDRTLDAMTKTPPTPRRGAMGQVRLRLSAATGALLSQETFGAAFELAPPYP
jgi:hypothetical protein